MNLINNLVVPEFKEFKHKPRNPECVTIDTTRLLVEILGGLKPAKKEAQDSEYSSNLLIDGKYSLVIRYKREKDGIYHPACILSYDIDKLGNIIINQIQGTKDKHVAYRFNSSFNSVAFYIKLLEESFSKRGIYIEVLDLPKGLENIANSSNANMTYDKLRSGITTLNKKYNLQKTIVN